MVVWDDAIGVVKGEQAVGEKIGEEEDDRSQFN